MELLTLLFLPAIVLSIAEGAICELEFCPCSIDPCLENEHTTLDDETRSASYFDDDSPALGDGSLVTGWYRFISSAGGDMPRFAPEPYSCQAKGPIWLDGDIPTDEKIQTRSVCVVSTSDPCVERYDICIRHCADFNVYFLTYTEYSTDRYCFGNETRCPEGSSSPNGFTPGCVSSEIPKLSNDPVLTYEVKEIVTSAKYNECKGETQFLCKAEDILENTELEVSWTINNQDIYTERIIHPSVSILNATMLIDNSDAIDLANGFTIKCQITPTRGGQKGESRFSNFYVGFEVADTTLEVTEGLDSVYYVASLTLPFNCKHRCGNADYTCDIRTYVEIPDSVDKSNGCIENQLTFKRAKSANSDYCETIVTLTPSSNALPQIRVPIDATIDGIYDGTFETFIQFSVQTDRGGDKIWENMKLPRAQVFVYDQDTSTIKGKHCKVYNDPHMLTFDGTYYEAQLSGYFTVYQHTSLPIQVQAYFKKDGGYTKICSVAVRSGPELFIINYCAGHGKNLQHYRLYQCGGLEGQNVGYSHQGNVYTLNLPTGTMTIQRHSILIKPSILDYQKVEGLCGTFSGECEDDLMFKGGDNVDEDISCNKQLFIKHPNAFTESWRLEYNNSLFSGKINDPEDFGDVVFCGCSGDGGKEKAVCSVTPEEKHCVNGEDITQQLKSGCLQRKKRDADVGSDDEEIYIDYSYDPDYVQPEPEWRNGWTEEAATKYCEDFFDCDSANACGGLGIVNVSTSVSECILDIYISGSSEFSQIHLSLLTSVCRDEIQRDDQLGKTNVTTENGTVISLAEQILNSICYNDCSGHGTCVFGDCVCDPDYTGFDCGVEKNYVPSLYEIPKDGLCDKSVRPCLATAVYGDQFIDTDVLSCETQVLDVTGVVLGNPTESPAEIEHDQKVFCQIPQDVVPYYVDIAVSNNGQDYSTPLRMVIYHSTCWNCNEEGCKEVSSSCEIDGECYGDRDTNPSNTDQYCDPERSRSSWSTDRSTASTGVENRPWLGSSILAICVTGWYIWQMMPFGGEA